MYAKMVWYRQYNADVRTSREAIARSAAEIGIEVREVSRDGIMLVGDEETVLVFLHFNSGPELPVYNSIPEPDSDFEDLI